MYVATTVYSIINVSAHVRVLRILTADEWAAKTPFVCLKDGRHFAELDSLFYKVQSEAHLCFLTIQE